MVREVNATCERHGCEMLYDTFGYPYCPDCDDEVYAVGAAVLGEAEEGK